MLDFLFIQGNIAASQTSHFSNLPNGCDVYYVSEASCHHVPVYNGDIVNIFSAENTAPDAEVPDSDVGNVIIQMPNQVHDSTHSSMDDWNSGVSDRNSFYVATADKWTDEYMDGWIFSKDPFVFHQEAMGVPATEGLNTEGSKYQSKTSISSTLKSEYLVTQRKPFPLKLPLLQVGRSASQLPPTAVLDEEELSSPRACGPVVSPRRVTRASPAHLAACGHACLYGAIDASSRAAQTGQAAGWAGDFHRSASQAADTLSPVAAYLLRSRGVGVSVGVNLGQVEEEEELVSPRSAGFIFLPHLAVEVATENGSSETDKVVGGAREILEEVGKEVEEVDRRDLEIEVSSAALGWQPATATATAAVAVEMDEEEKRPEPASSPFMGQQVVDVFLATAASGEDLHMEALSSAMTNGEDRQAGAVEAAPSSSAQAKGERAILQTAISAALGRAWREGTPSASVAAVSPRLSSQSVAAPTAAQLLRGLDRASAVSESQVCGGGDGCRFSGSGEEGEDEGPSAPHRGAVRRATGCPAVAVMVA